MDVKKGSKPKYAHKKNIFRVFSEEQNNVHHRRARRKGPHTLRGGSLRVILELSRSAKLL